MALKVEGLDGFLRHISRIETTAKTFDTKVITGLANEAKRAVIASASPNHLSRFANGKGITLTARVVVKPGEVPTAMVFPTPPGPWYLLERGGKEHQIGSRRKGQPGRKGIRNQVGFLGQASNGMHAVGPVNHPAATPRHTWDRSADVALSLGSKTFQRELSKQYVKFFAG